MVAVVAVPLCAALVIALEGGIDVGGGNHAGLLPLVRRLLDPTYLPGDFGIELRLHHHRPWTWLVARLAGLVGEAVALALLTWAGLLLAFAGLWRLARAAGLGAGAAALTCALLATGSLFLDRGLEINRFLGNGPIMPPTFAHGFVLLSLASLLRGRWAAALAWGGAVALLHVQIGVIWLAVLTGLAWLDRAHLRVGAVGLGGLAFAAIAAPALLDLVMLWQGGVAGPGYTVADIEFRMPQHFRLRSAGNGLKVLAYLLLLWAVFRHHAARSIPNAPAIRRLAWAATIVVALAALHLLDYHVLRLGTLAQVQTLRLSPLVPVLGAVALASWAQWAAGRRAPPRLAQPALAAAAVLLAVGKTSLQHWSGEPLGLAVNRYADAGTDWTEIGRWVREHGPRDGLYVTPPGQPGFTSIAERSTLVDFKVNPDGGRGLAEWYERLRAVTGGGLPATGDYGDNARALDTAYAGLPDEGFAQLTERYGVRYAIVAASQSVPGRELYRNRSYKVVALPPAS